MITYLSTGDLPISDRSARKMWMLADQFTLDGGVLWHFFVPKSRHGKRKLLTLKQLCIPATLKLDILKSFHEQGSSHKSLKALFETIRQKYCWFYLYSDILLYCRQCKGCHMAKKRTHPNKMPLHCLEWFFFIKFWPIYQVLLIQILKTTGTV